MEKNKPAVDSRLLFFNALREKFRRPLLPVEPPIADDTEAVPPLKSARAYGEFLSRAMS